MYDVYGDAAMIVISYMSIAKRRRKNFGRKGMSSNGVWICVATATMWRVPAVRSRHEQLKPERLGRRQCRDELVERRARLMMTNEVVALIRDRPPASFLHTLSNFGVRNACQPQRNTVASWQTLAGLLSFWYCFTKGNRTISRQTNSPSVNPLAGRQPGRGNLPPLQGVFLCKISASYQRNVKVVSWHYH